MKCRICEQPSYRFLTISPCNCAGRVHEQCIIGSVCMECHQAYKLPVKGCSIPALYVLSMLFTVILSTYNAVGLLLQVSALCLGSLCYTLFTVTLYHLRARLYSVVMVGWIVGYICGVAIWSSPTWYVLALTYIQIVLLSVMLYLDCKPMVHIDYMPTV